MSIAWTEAADNRQIYEFAWGDWDADGDLDLGLARQSDSCRVYDNSLAVVPLATSPAWSDTDAVGYRGVAWIDEDGDGDLDLAATANNSNDRIFTNLGPTGTGLSTTGGWLSSGTSPS